MDQVIEAGRRRSGAARQRAMDTGITIHRVGMMDGELFARIADGVFDNPVDPRWLGQFLADPRHHMVLAVRNEVIVGMASGVHYVHPDKPPELWVNEVGVADEWRSQGIGTRLMQSLLDIGREVGCTEAWLGTEPENTAARRLYAAVGGAEQAMVYVTFPLLPEAEAAEEGCTADD